MHYYCLTLTMAFKLYLELLPEILRDLNRYDHVSEHVIRFLGFPFKTFIELRLLQFFYKLIKSYTPSLLCSKFIFSRSVRNPQLSSPLIIVGMYERSFLVRVTRLWNRLPLHLRKFSFTEEAFKHQFLEFRLSNLC